MRRLLPTLLLLALAPAAAFAGVTWQGGFETGNIGEWTRAQEVAADRLQVVNSPVRDGKYGLKVTVHQGDNPAHASGNRNELLYNSLEPQNSEYWYRWSTLFPADYPSVRAWQVFMQWHQQALSGGSPPISFYTYGDEIRLHVGEFNDVVIWQGPLVREKWQDFVFHVKWSKDPNVGFVELYLNGVNVVPRKMIATGYDNYIKMGLYRNDIISQDTVVYEDGVVQGTSRADVEPPAAPAEVATGSDSSSGSSSSASGAGTAATTSGKGSSDFAGAQGGCSTTGSGGASGVAAALAAGAMLTLSRRRKRAALKVRA